MQTMLKCHPTEAQTEDQFKSRLHGRMMLRPELTRLKELIYDIEFRDKREQFCTLLRTLYHSSSFHSIVMSDQNDEELLKKCHQIFYKEYNNLLKDIQR